MGRTKEFDPDSMVHSAMELFWRKGYAATSMQDIVDHLGIGRGSIYATFGSKHELYLLALDRYAELNGAAAVRQLARPGRVLPAVRAFISSVAEEALADADHKGCLVTNTAIECLPGDRLAGRKVESNLTGLETAIAGALVRAQGQGELGEERDPHVLARFLVTLVQGIRVMAKIPDVRRVRDAVDQALTLLD